MFTHTPRQERVPFTRPVRVMTLDGQRPPMRLLSGNLSQGGMFLRSPLMLEEGTRVELSLEAKGMPLPLAEAEVVWQREPASGAITLPGFGVRFTQFLHPRAEELVQTLIARKKDDGPVGEFSEDAAPSERPPFIPGAVHLSNGAAGLETLAQEHQAGSFPEVIPLTEEDLQPEEATTPKSALRPMRSRVLGVFAFALLLALPIGVAVGTWRAVTSVDPVATLARAQAAVPTTQPAVTLITAPPPSPELLDPVAAAPTPPPSAAETLPAEPEGALAAPPATEPLIDVQPSDPTPRKEAKPAPTKPAPQAEAKPAKPEGKPSHAPSFPESKSLALNSVAVPTLRAASRGDEIRFDLELAKGSRIARSFSLASPARVVVDVAGAKPKSSSAVSVRDVQGVRQVRVGALAEGTRLVIDVARPVAVLVREGPQLSVHLR